MGHICMCYRQYFQIACLLLSLEAAYSPAKQLALDMMARLVVLISASLSLNFKHKDHHVQITFHIG